MKHWRALLVIVAIASFAVALSYPIRYRLAEQSNNAELGELSTMRRRAQENMASEALDDTSEAVGVQTVGDAPGPEGGVEAPPGGQLSPGQEPSSGDGTEASPQRPASPEGGADAAQGGQLSPGQEPSTGDGTEASPQRPASPGDGMDVPVDEPIFSEGGEAWQPELVTEGMWSMLTPGPTPTPTPRPGAKDEVAAPSFSLAPHQTPELKDLILDGVPGATPSPTPSPRPTPTHMFGPTLTPSPTPDRSLRTGAASYNTKEKVLLDESKILPELREIYALNHDLVGWIYIKDTIIDYPVVQTQDSKFYLKHDFYGNDNSNGQIILDTKCDPYTPSYNLIISGHHMNNGSMFGGLPKYRDRKYWEEHKVVEFDTLMARKRYVIFAVFYSADYDEDETGFRYNADIQYRIDAEQWLSEVRENQVYDTGIDAEYGDEFITLTTCDRSRRRNGRFVAVGRRIRKGEVIK